MTTPSLRQIVESILFVSETPVTLDRLSSVLEEFERGEIRGVLQDLRQEYEESGRGMVLAEVAEGYQFRTEPGTADYIRRLNKTKPVRFSQSAMECLAIVAYRQPITRAEVEYLRGVDCGGTLKTLLDKKLIRILGKKDIPGRPLIYGTSKEFLEIFGLKSLAALPTLKEMQDLTAEPVFEDQQELPLEAAPAPVEELEQE